MIGAPLPYVLYTYVPEKAFRTIIANVTLFANNRDEIKITDADSHDPSSYNKKKCLFIAIKLLSLLDVQYNCGSKNHCSVA